MVLEMETTQLAALGEAHGNGGVEICRAIIVPLWICLPGTLRVYLDLKCLCSCTHFFVYFSKATVLPSSASSVRQGAFILGGDTVT